MTNVSIKELMHQSGVGFGTSGARGLVSKMTDQVCMAYTSAFLNHLEATASSDRPRLLLVGGDRRPSTPRIMRAVAEAARERGYEVKSGGLIPSPALALWGMTLGAPAVMVTGSHIPDDRNGLKFTTARGEITKEDESGIRAQSVDLHSAFDQEGMLVEPTPLPLADAAPEQLYVKRYVDAFGRAALSGMRLGVYGHSAVGRDLLLQLYKQLGAEVVALGWSDTFIPVDTEAIRPEDELLAANWAKNERFDALVSTDGDSDRPLFGDEFGVWFRGDLTGILTAHFLGADAVALPVSCNTALEKSNWFAHVRRTRIGSPFVIAGLNELAQLGARAVVGYEANGGFFTQTPITLQIKNQDDRILPALPTRDPVIVHIAMLLLARAKGLAVSTLRNLLPKRVTESGRDQNFSQQQSQALLSRLSQLGPVELAAVFNLGAVTHIDQTDGLRISFASEEILHLRPSGNAPELRCYAEADTQERAAQLVGHGLSIARQVAER